MSSSDFTVRYVATARGSIGTVDLASLGDFDYPIEMLIGAWVLVASRAKESVDVASLLQATDRFPVVLGQRLRAWLLTLDLEALKETAIRHIADGIRERSPSGDDCLLVQRIGETTAAASAESAWREALGSAPDIQVLLAALRKKSPDVTWVRARAWAGTLPESVTEGWRNAIALMDSHDGGATGDPVGVPTTGIGYVGSPMSRDDLLKQSPIETCRRVAAWRPTPTEFDVNARGLGQALEDVVVAADDDRWTRTPFQFVCALHEPTYIAHYLVGMTRVLKERRLSSVSGELLDVIDLVQDGPWGVVALGQPDFDFDADWEWTRSASIDLLKMMAHSDTGFSDRREKAWSILERYVRSPGEPEEFYGDDAQWLVNTAINWRRTRALDAAIAFVAWERRAGGDLREEARTLFAYAMDLRGRAGVLCRAIIACSLHVLERVCPGWLADNMSHLFEDESPGNMSAKTLELALSWARPPALRRVLEAYPQRVEEASMAGVGNAFVRYVGAMIYSVRGYTPGGVFECIRKNEALAESVGSILRELLGSEAEEAVVKSVLEFWRQAIHNGPKVMLPQFGWLALVDRIDDEIWTTRMLETLQKTGGRVAGDIKKYVAERAAGLRPSREALRIMDHLVRESTRFDDVLVFPEARKMMEKSRDLYGSDEYRRVEAALAERGAQE